MKQRFWIAISCLFLLCLMPAGVASAHFLQSNNGTDGILHIDPNDAPISNRHITVVFYMSNGANTFKVSDCGCSMKIVSAGKTVTIVATGGSDTTVSSPYIFSKPGAYQVILNGTSKTNTFKPFQLKYVLRVSSADGSFSIYDQGTQVVLFSTASLAVLAFVAYRHIADGGRYKVKKEEK